MKKFIEEKRKKLIKKKKMEGKQKIQKTKKRKRILKMLHIKLRKIEKNWEKRKKYQERFEEKENKSENPCRNSTSERKYIPYETASPNVKEKTLSSSIIILSQNFLLRIKEFLTHYICLYHLLIVQWFLYHPIV